MKIMIMGASGAGATTLGENFIKNNNVFLHLDSDSYFWEKTDPPFQTEKSADERNSLFESDFYSQKNVVVTGSIFHWNTTYKNLFDLVVLLYIPKEIRLQRLAEREISRYGNKILSDEKLNTKYNAFLAWASEYDLEENTTTRSLKQQKQWMTEVKCATLFLEGDLTVKERLDILQNYIA
ncbi:AAA family ATPase [Flavobacterium sp.]|uniref:AAA family ATPase n=1 Tax=Flavobacterium sp. TaxID=239 RepID=UPI00374DEBAE